MKEGECTQLKILSLMTYDVFRFSYGWALESMGHKVYHLNRMDAALIDGAIRSFKPNMIVTMGWDVEHEKLFKLMPILRFHNIFHLYFAEEDYLSFERWSKRFAVSASPDFVLTRSKDCIQKYKDMGMQAEYLDVGCSPEFHRPMKPDRRYVCDVSIVDHFSYKPNVFLHKSISDLIVPLFDCDFNIRLWGKKWETDAKLYFGKSPHPRILQGILPFHHTPKVYNSAKINVSPQNVHDQISNRTYDILCSGGFLLTSDTPGVREKLKPGVHCEVSGSPEETIEKIRFYLKNEGKRKKIMEEGHQYAVEAFSYKNTLPKVWPRIMSAWEKHRMKQANEIPANDSYYIVKKGDTLFEIAKRFDVTVDRIKLLNGLKNDDISVYQVLKMK